MRNTRDSYGHILDQEAKTKRFSQCPSVRSSAKLLYTKTYERIEIIACGFFV